MFAMQPVAVAVRARRNLEPLVSVAPVLEWPQQLEPVHVVKCEQVMRLRTPVLVAVAVAMKTDLPVTLWELLVTVVPEW
jgi:hypothetical protein